MKSQILLFNFLFLLLAGPALAQSPFRFKAIGGLSQAAHRQLVKAQLLSCADSLGIDAGRLYVPAGSDTLFAWVHELRYGHRPRNISHLALSERIDTSAIQRVLNLMLVPGFGSLPELLRSFAPVPERYQQLVHHYQRFRREHQSDSLAALRSTLNQYRWINRFADSTYVLVNIPAAELHVLNSLGQELLRMRVIVGKKIHQTPAMATYCSSLTLYPYWNVPRSIAIGEMLPKIKKDIGYLDRNQLQLIDADGREVSPATINWAGMNAKTFTYRFRQSTGCDNALGVVKFNLDNPFSIYLHDTNIRSLFSQKSRWLSHGCVRVEKPDELANLMLGKEYMDAEFLNKCLINATPGTLKLDHPMPVFILYQTVDLDQQGNLQWYPNPYNWVL